MSDVKVILTFDDGPDTQSGSANRTQRVLSVLDDHDINAVFFIQSHAKNDQNNYFRGMHSRGIQVVEQAHNEGHIIGVHTGMDGKEAHAWANRHTRREAIGELDGDLTRCKNYIRARTGSNPLYVRPPFGSNNAAVRNRYSAHNLNMIMWDIESRDAYGGYDEDDVVDRLESEIYRLLSRGDRNLVILFHDTHPTTSKTATLNRYIKTIKDEIHEFGLTPDLVHTKQEIHNILSNY